MTIKYIVEWVEREIIGRVANKVGDRRTNNLEILLKYINMSDGGNYLEIGTLFGGSAIAVALYKNELKQDGFVFCVDPLDGYYTEIAPRSDMVDVQSGFPVTPATLVSNIKKFNVQNRVFVMADYSTAITDFSDLVFSVVYIDGNHRGEVPYQDWLKVKEHTTKYVIFDNCDDLHPDVQRAVQKASSDPGWEIIHQEDITCVLGRLCPK